MHPCRATRVREADPPAPALPPPRTCCCGGCCAAAPAPLLAAAAAAAGAWRLPSDSLKASILVSWALAQALITFRP